MFPIARLSSPPISVELHGTTPHTRWTSKVISCSSQISEPWTSLVAPPFTTLTPYWVCSNSFVANPTWLPSPLWPNSRFSIHHHQLDLIHVFLLFPRFHLSFFHTPDFLTASSSNFSCHHYAVGVQQVPASSIILHLLLLWLPPALPPQMAGTQCWPLDILPILSKTHS